MSYPMKKAEKRFLTTGETAHFCGVTLRTVINWIKRGKLPAHQLPGTRGDNRIAHQDLVNFMQENKLPIPPELAPPAEQAALAEKPPVALVVDDDPLMAKSISRVLKSIGHQPHIAHNGFVAGQIYSSEKPILMTLDLQMPKLDGFELLEQLRDRQHCKIIVISGMAPEYLKKAKDAGANATLGKPFSNAALEETVAEVLAFSENPQNITN